MTSRTLAKRIAELALAKKAGDVVIMDLRKITSTTDFFVICSADSDTQVKAIADSIRDGTEALGSGPWQYEGYQALSWIILDFVDVVAHVFHRDSRAFYKLERLWSDAEIKEVQEDGTLKKRSASRRLPAARTAGKRKKKTFA
ncbi:MAG: ribosome silencing factor [Bacteroidota bacterium]